MKDERLHNLNLYILQVLRDHSDASEGHQLRQADIEKLIAQDYKLKVDRRHIPARLRQIQSMDEYADKVHSVTHGLPGSAGAYNTYYYEDKQEFDAFEAGMLADAAVWTDGMTESGTKSLLSKIRGFTARGDRKNSTFVNNGLLLLSHKMKQDAALREKFTLIRHAVDKGRQIVFMYGDFSRSLEQEYSVKMTVSPYALVLHGNEYYLIGGVQKNAETREVAIRVFRLRRINEVQEWKMRRILPPSLTGWGVRNPENGQITFDTVRFLNEHILLREGIALEDAIVRARIRVKEEALADAEALFYGRAMILRPEKDKDYAELTVTCDERDILCWVLSHPGSAEIVSPKDLRQNAFYLGLQVTSDHTENPYLKWKAVPDSISAETRAALTALHRECLRAEEASAANASAANASADNEAAPGACTGVFASPDTGFAAGLPDSISSDDAGRRAEADDTGRPEAEHAGQSADASAVRPAAEAAEAPGEKAAESFAGTEEVKKKKKPIALVKVKIKDDKKDKKKKEKERAGKKDKDRKKKKNK